MVVWGMTYHGHFMVSFMEWGAFLGSFLVEWLEVWDCLQSMTFRTFCLQLETCLKVRQGTSWVKGALRHKLLMEEINVSFGRIPAWLGRLWWLHASANLKEVLSSCLAIINVCLILNVCKLAHDAVVPQEKFELGSPPLLCDVAQPICIPTQTALTLGSRKCKFITQHIKSCCCFSLPGSAGYCRFLQNDPAAIATCDFEEGAQEIERQNVINLQPDFGIFGTWATDHWSDLFTHQLGTEIPWLLEVISGFCREVWET